ncbi:MAG: GNAT family N-acetyltransferase [Gemmatimonadales bacterium]
MPATRTYLELTHPGQFRPAFGTFPDLVVARAARPTPALYRHCYRTVGEAYQWRERWDWSDAEIGAHLASPDILLYVATGQAAGPGDELAGWYELRRVADDASVEIAYFGIVAAQFGRGLGKHLLSCAVRDAWTPAPSSPGLRAPRRVWLHTCTLDHPHALPNYLARGFVPYRTEQYEVNSRA